ncbi:carbonic anhydrase [Legionella fallonii]|uniref:carbonic anhydrase n=1 Tax=Legionella fallonii LLAP-10 TaxID=1212491 RepID=A0A098G0L4_9GAMM|nr:carbonic anhydrase [Legionella fallonii]CEG56052.1 Carbonic anhydrase [Legionella fallonii LLAP-10]
MLIKLMLGVLEFQGEPYKQMQEMYSYLAKGQSPKTLFITCADSRVDPNVITQSKPGKIFVLRNVGNIIPPAHLPSGESAGIEYPLNELPIEDIIICGHSNCGAMKGLLTPDLKSRLPNTAAWLTHSHSVLEQLTHSQESNFDAKVKQATQLNILVQMEHLKSHPIVAKKLANNDITIHGWFYDIEKGTIFVYDTPSKEFIPFKDALTKAVSARRDKIIEQIAMDYLEPLTHPKTAKEYKALMQFFSLLEKDLLPIWSNIKEKATQKLWTELGGLYSNIDDPQFSTLLEQGSQLKLSHLKDFQQNVMESSGYHQYMSNMIRHSLFAPSTRPITLPITINIPYSSSLNLNC